MNAAARAALAEAIESLRAAQEAIDRVAAADRRWIYDAAHWRKEIGEIVSCDSGEAGLEAELRRWSPVEVQS